MNDALGDRMKDYENRFRNFLPKRAFTMLRLDGKAFHTYTRGLERPFDMGLINSMNHAAKYLCENIQGTHLAYVQSDEITLVLSDFKKITSDSWFDGNINKINSIASSMATYAFGAYREEFYADNRPAFFDCRCWSLADPYEVENTFIWRQNDAARNSIMLVAQSLYSHKELHGKNQSDMHDMIHAKGQNWNDCDVGCKRGRAVIKTYYEKEVDVPGRGIKKALRSKWETVEPPIFTQDRSFLRKLIPLIPSWDDTQQ